MNLEEYVNSIQTKKIAVLGIGISNIPLIRLLCSYGCDVTACDKRSFSELGSVALDLISAGAKLKLGDDYLENLDHDLIFRTPGLMPFHIHPENESAEVTSEMELFFRLCPCRTVAITGSDGKTTTSSIIACLLEESGYRVHLGGNIGKPLLCEIPLMSENDICVLELSSFQLHSMLCSPDVAVITNISPNHLDKHKDFDDYVDAKKQIFLHQKANAKLVLNADDALVSTFPGTDYFSVEAPVNGTYLQDGILYRYGRPLLNADEIFIPGIHNIKNFLAAFAATEGLVSDSVCCKVAKEFKGVEHRLEFVRELNGVVFINDSIGSSPSRTIAGLHAMKRKPIVILGGYDKQIPFDELGNELLKYGKKAVLTGATADKIADAINAAGSFEYEKVPDFDSAVRRAYELAEPNDIVLFSPACASFDCFRNFEERGKHFKKLIMELS